MERIVKIGVVQCSTPKTTGTFDEIRGAMIEKHLGLIKKAHESGVKILGLQEVFNGPFFPACEDKKWYGFAEEVPNGPTVKIIQEQAKKYNMVIIAPVYEREMAGVYYNTAAVIDADGSYLGKYRKTHIPQGSGFNEKYYFKPGNLGFPVFKTKYATIGVYICYDRHFPEGARALALRGAEIIFNPSATIKSTSHYMWKIEQPGLACANAVYVATNNRVGWEDPWRHGYFYGTSYVVDPKGVIIAEGSEDKDEVVVADCNLSVIDDVRHNYQFFRDRRPDLYGDLVDKNL
ncbi:MAG: acyltransferase [Bdellovibrio sp.]|nr:acyltransferase [Bdellovibrio sp.]